jgi:hypothetical protein
MSDEVNGHSAEDSEQLDEQAVNSEQSQQPEANEGSTEESDSQPAEETCQSPESSNERPTEETEQPSEESEQSAEQTGEQVNAGGSGPEAAGSEAPCEEDLSAKRQAMLDLINKWMPTSLNNPRIPDGETQDLMAIAGWTKARGQQSKQEKDGGGHPVTSCGDVLAAMLRLWGSSFVGAFMIRDQDAKGRSPGAKGLGYYVEADGVQSPRPGDIIVLRNGTGNSSAGSVGHVGILVESGEAEWRTADGGGGALPDQTASVTTRSVRFENSIPILKSPTDLKEKQLDGWVDLEKLERTG